MKDGRSHSRCIRIFLILCIYLSAACSYSDRDPISEKKLAIVNGYTYQGHPSVAQLETSIGAICTATLIGEKTALTAAHCVFDISTMKLFFGDQSYTLSGVIAHPGFSDLTYINDIALLKLEEAPPVIPSEISRQKLASGLDITLVGFGTTSEYADDGGIKRIGYNVIEQIDSTRFLAFGASDEKANTCYGDSGGPVYATIGGKRLLVGITSSGTGVCGENGIYTRVDAYKEWIEKNANEKLYQATTDNHDTSPPSVKIESPSDGAILESHQITIKANIQDNVSVVNAKLFANDKLIASLENAPYSFSADIFKGEDIELKVVAFDASGNRGDSIIKVDINSGPDEIIQVGFGETCQSDDYCKSKLCVDDNQSTEKYCTYYCSSQVNNCPGDTECLLEGNRFICSKPLEPIIEKEPTTQSKSLEGNCSTFHANPYNAASIFIALFGLYLLNRRRRLNEK